ncbi:MAG TPA: hypothetical protein PLL98_01080 [Bacillota bacterium]|nr:hypothetical protein [Bacillota bacterium]HOR85054.1 hypothetical protein [Bacillota bacterium]HPL53045.1 hypothetical protein [Bacillota bacterium]
MPYIGSVRPSKKKAPIGDVIGITRQNSVLIYQFVDAFSNVLTPTSGFFIPAPGISYGCPRQLCNHRYRGRRAILVPHTS